MTAADGHAETPLHDAAWSGDLDAVKRLVDRGFDVNSKDSVGETAIFGAVSWSHRNIVACLSRKVREST